MRLGETIYRLRTEKNLSQGDLADRLEVSRQSVSKWENDSAVPDLAKIVKLSEVFEVSLDELVKGEKLQQDSEAVQQRELIPAMEIPRQTDVNKGKTEVKTGFNNESDTKKSGSKGRMIAGTILLCMAFLVMLLVSLAGDVWAGVCCALPFLACGIVCFVFKKNVGLWCAWAIYLLVDIYLTFGTSISKAIVFQLSHWTTANIVSWMWILGLVILITVTVIRLGKMPFSSGKKGNIRLYAPWIALLVLQVLSRIWGGSLIRWYHPEHFIPILLYVLVSTLLSWARMFALTMGLVMVVRYVRGRKKDLPTGRSLKNKKIL